jgi:hypothetical protein
MKVYWIIDKVNGTPAVCSSLRAVSNVTFIGYSKLSYHFSRLKKVEFETDLFRINSTTLIRSKRDESKNND